MSEHGAVGLVRDGTGWNWRARVVIRSNVLSFTASISLGILLLLSFPSLHLFQNTWFDVQPS